MRGGTKLCARVLHKAQQGFPCMRPQICTCVLDCPNAASSKNDVPGGSTTSELGGFTLTIVPRPSAASWLARGRHRATTFTLSVLTLDFEGDMAMCCASTEAS